MTAGSLILHYQQKFEHGLITAYYRDRIRASILRTPAVVSTTEKSCEIHVLTSSNDWINLLWALKSFYAASRRRYALCIHDDGSLTAETLRTLSTHFPAARIIAKSEADAAVLPSLAVYPRCLEFRRTNHLAPKLFDFAHYLESERMLLVDSDVLFFAEPTELLKRIEDKTYLRNAVNGDVESAYTVSVQAARKHAGVELIERFNSGLGLIHRDSLRLDWIEEFLAIPGVISHFWRIEQTLFALCSSRFGVELLPPHYDVRLNGRLNGSCVRHYVGAIRHLFYREGIRYLHRNGFTRC